MQKQQQQQQQQSLIDVRVRTQNAFMRTECMTSKTMCDSCFLCFFSEDDYRFKYTLTQSVSALSTAGVAPPCDATMIIDLRSELRKP